ncbi:hypothetical protein CXP54_23325 [Escherichia albertii]|nr:hypothetical protein CXP54_23325 [Escherichia albertii]EEV9344393.1 hypothetical protein [Escherichia coli]EEX2593771.1 hypothetical protein [Escherichia coli]EEY7571059.1 hypothetical protein [Escherichia coli]EFO0150008.1 hypothetical protein [Escherichia coli]
MTLSPIENCRISFLPPRKDGLLKKLHPKELTEFPDIFAGIAIPFVCIYNIAKSWLFYQAIVIT